MKRHENPGENTNREYKPKCTMKEKEKNERKSVEVSLSKSERNRILEDLVFKGETFHEESVFDGKVNIKLKSLTVSDQMEIDKKASEIEGSNLEFWRGYAMLMLSHALVVFGKDDLSRRPPEDRLEYLKSKPTVLVGRLVEVNEAFSKKIQAATGGDNIEEVFFETPSTSSE